VVANRANPLRSTKQNSKVGFVFLVFLFFFGIMGEGVGRTEEVKLSVAASLKDMVGEAADDMAVGGIQMGAAETMADVAETLVE